MADGAKVCGLHFFKFMQLSDGSSSILCLLVAVSSASQGKKLGAGLFRLMLKQERPDSVYAVTHTPSGVQQSVDASQTGYRSYYCGLRDGDPSIPLSSDEEAKLDLVMREGVDMEIAEYGLTDLQHGLPPHYVSYGGNSIPPRRLEEVRLLSGSPICNTLM